MDGWMEPMWIAPVRTEQQMLPAQAWVTPGAQPGVTVGGVCAWLGHWDGTSATRKPPLLRLSLP